LFVLICILVFVLFVIDHQLYQGPPIIAIDGEFDKYPVNTFSENRCGINRNRLIQRNCLVGSKHISINIEIDQNINRAQIV